MVTTYGEKDLICGNENMEDGSGRTPKDTKSETELGVTKIKEALDWRTWILKIRCAYSK